MLLGFVIIFADIFVSWLVFVRLKWLKFTKIWAVLLVISYIHLYLIFFVGLRFMTPYSTEANMIQHTIQITPRLPEPTLVTDVLVQANTHVKKGQALFQMDKRPYQEKLDQAIAQHAKAMGLMNYALYQLKLSKDLVRKGAGPQEDVQKWESQLVAEEATIKLAEVAKSQAQFYLDNTLITAPEDGYLMNIQVRPGTLAGDYRIGAIASFICDADRFLLADFFQENLKYVKPGQEVEVAFNLYPGQIFKGKVESVWMGSREGQLLPSGYLPTFKYKSPDRPRNQFGVAIKMNDSDQGKFPIGAQARATIYTHPASLFSAMRKVDIRSYSWSNFLYPFSFFE